MLLIQDIELSEALLMVVYMVIIIEYLRYSILMVSQMGSFVAILGIFCWEGYLIQIVDMRENPPVVYHMVYLI